MRQYPAKCVEVNKLLLQILRRWRLFRWRLFRWRLFRWRLFWLFRGYLALVLFISVMFAVKLYVNENKSSVFIQKLLTETPPSTPPAHCHLNFHHHPCCCILLRGSEEDVIVIIVIIGSNFQRGSLKKIQKIKILGGINRVKYEIEWNI